MNFEWWFGVLTSFAVGWAANWAFQWYLAYSATRADRQKYVAIAGKYTTHSFPKDSEQVDLVDPSGHCEITHEKENVLRLRYDELAVDHAWEATIWMDSPYAGSMAWRYVRFFGKEPPDEHRFGFKRCQVVSKPRQDGMPQTFIYVSGDNDGYGKELWTKQR